MTIEERSIREAYDLENPWRPLSTAKPDGTISELLFNDMAGYFPGDASRYFMTEDREWCRIEPPGPVYAVPMNWRPAQVRLGPERRKSLLRQRYR
jgi:hypothetical protein